MFGFITLRIFHLRTHSHKTMLGGVLLSMGTVFLALSAAYVGFGVWADSRIEELNYSLERPSNSQARVVGDQIEPSVYTNQDFPALLVKLLRTLIRLRSI